MKKTSIYRFLLIALTIFLLLSTFSASNKKSKEPQKVIIVEAETVKKEKNGEIKIMEGRPGSSGDKCIAYWDYENHSLEYEFKVPVTGEYKIFIRYCQGRGIDVYRDLQIDKKYPNPALKKITLPDTGGWSKTEDEWNNFMVVDNDNKPVIVKLRAGKRRIIINNLGGSEQGIKPSVNLDLIAFVEKNQDESALKSVIYGEMKETEKVEVMKGNIPAFPGAEGSGKWSIGGKGGKIIEVTNLNDSGPGSLRDAIEQKGPRIVVFRVSGTIALKSVLLINSPYITIAGQTAPGDGICIRDNSVIINTDHVIFRYIRIRLGDTSKQEADSLTIRGGHHVIVDHVSASWSVDETLSVDSEYKQDYVTVQWSFITQSLNCSVHSKGCHGYGSLIRGGKGEHVSYHHNLYAHNSGRNPRPGNFDDAKKDPIGLMFDFTNNVVYNWGGPHAGYNADSESITKVNFINNYYIKGKNSNGAIAYNEQCKLNQGYFIGNYMEGQKPSDPWSLVNFDGFKPEEISKYKLSKPIEIELVNAEDGASAYKKILEHGGASLPKRDSIDISIINDVKNKTGQIINSQKEVGGWPELKSTTPPKDSDKDGMPDEWELKNKLNPNKNDSSEDPDKNGYTNIEEYLNSIDSFK